MPSATASRPHTRTHPPRDCVRALSHASPAAPSQGKVVHTLSGVRGEVYPAFSVGEGAVLEPNFGGKSYAYEVPAGFQGIIKTMSLL